MNRTFFIKMTALFLLCLLLSSETMVNAQPPARITGIVFHDKDENGIYDAGRDKPLKGVAVSNGRDVVVTNREGKYSLPFRDNAAIFVIKPRNWMVSVSEKQLPHFYYLHSSAGISGEKFEGVAPTGPLPDAVNFPLYQHKEPDKLKVLVFGDTQPRDAKEIYYMSHDVLPELAGSDADFGVTLGDVVFNDLNLYDHITSAISTVGIPWWYVPGNHDNDYTGNNSTEARGAWFRTFGPSYYAFTYGPAHFIVLDDIRWIVEGEKRYYRTGFGKDQMEFLQNEFKRLDDDQLLVLLAHIPWETSTEWQDEGEKQALYQLLASHPNSVTLAAHTHRHYHHFIDKEQGLPGNRPHHLVSMGTVCGAWWTGAPDEYGIPHAMMSDGTPNSYAYLHIDGNEWELTWKAAGRSESYQMQVNAPDAVKADEINEVTVSANIYNALPSAEVKMRIGKGDEWVEMKRVPQPDPVRLAAVEAENRLGEVPWRKMGRTVDSEHIWTASPVIKLEPGVYPIEVVAKDAWHEYRGNSLLHVK